LKWNTEGYYTSRLMYGLGIRVSPGAVAEALRSADDRANPPELLVVCGLLRSCDTFQWNRTHGVTYEP